MNRHCGSRAFFQPQLTRGTRRTALLVAALTLVAPEVAPAKLVYQRIDSHPGNDYPHAILAARNDGSGAHRIASGYAPSVSPSGHKVAYFRGADLFVVGIGGRHRHRLARRAYGDSEPEARLGWSADDRRIVTDYYGPQGGDAFLVDVRQHTARRIGQGDFFGGASFAPTGLRFALGDGDSTSRSSGALVIYHGHPYKQRFVDEGQGPVWGRLGLAFADYPPSGDEPRDPLVRLRSNDGRVRTVFTEHASMLFPVDWSGGGRELLIAETRMGANTTSPFRAVLLRLGTGQLVRVPGSFSNIWGLSRDGSQVLAEKGGNVVSARTDGTVTVLARHAEHPTWTK